MSDGSEWFFLWLRGLRGPEPQLVRGARGVPFIDNGIKRRVISTRKVEYTTLSLAELALLYPPPKDDGDGK